MVDFKSIRNEMVDRAFDGARDLGDALQRRRDTRLQKAVVADNPAKVIEAIRAGGNPNFQADVKKYDKEGTFEKVALLELSIRYCNLKCARELIHAHADVRKPFNDGRGALQHMVQLLYKEESYELIDLLRKRKLDLTEDAGPDQRLRTVLFSLASSPGAQDLLREALLLGTDASLPNKDGTLAEDYPLRKNHEANMNMIRMHRLAPMLPKEIGAITREDLLAPNEHGLCALDHWDTWMRYDEIQQSLSARDEPGLTGGDLIQPVPGMHYQGKEATRVQLLLQTVPGMEKTIFEWDLWEDDKPANLQTMMKQLPEEVQESAPYHGIILAMNRNRAQVVRSGWSGAR